MTHQFQDIYKSFYREIYLDENMLWYREVLNKSPENTFARSRFMGNGMLKKARLGLFPLGKRTAV